MKEATQGAPFRAIVPRAPYQQYQREALSEEEREQLILEHLPQVRLIARRIHDRLPE